MDENIKNAIEAAINDNANAYNDAIQAALSAKVEYAIQARKQEIALNLIAQPEE
jgi:hypothetical protein